jgi:NAD(P)-dependent dehydrogenase (short-subunit alcohol dehydrogenase family)
VRGTLLSDDGEAGRARVTISDASAGTLYAEAHYEFSRHERTDPTEGRDSEAAAFPGVRGEAPVLVTGASGALGSAVLEVLAAKGLGISRSRGTGGLQIPDLATISEHDLPDSIGGIVHCAWPAPDNQRLIELSAPEDALDHHLSRPLAAALALARLLAERGRPGAPLVLVGSTAADPGRHNYRMPLYTLAKSTIPVLARILALELAPLDRRCMAVTFDVIDGGMNADLSARARLVNVDRSPFGRLPTPVEAAEQIAWVIENRSFLASGATLHLTGGAIP